MMLIDDLAGAKAPGPSSNNHGEKQAPADFPWRGIVFMGDPTKGHSCLFDDSGNLPN